MYRAYYLVKAARYYSVYSTPIQFNSNESPVLCNYKQTQYNNYRYVTNKNNQIMWFFDLGAILQQQSGDVI